MKMEVFSRFDKDISELDCRASRHHRSLEKIEGSLDQITDWEANAQVSVNDLLSRVQKLKEREQIKDDKIGVLEHELFNALSKIEEMEGKLCHCVPVEGSTASPIEVVDSDDEDEDSSSEGLAHSSAGSSSYVDAPQVPPRSVVALLRPLSSSPEPAGLSQGPCTCTNHPEAPVTPPSSPPSYAVSGQTCTRSAGRIRSRFHPYRRDRSPSTFMGLPMCLELTREFQRNYFEQRRSGSRAGVGFSSGGDDSDESGSWRTDRSVVVGGDDDAEGRS